MFSHEKHGNLYLIYIPNCPGLWKHKAKMKEKEHWIQILDFCAFLCYHFLGPLMVTQYSYSLCISDLTLISPGHSYDILCAKIDSWHLHSYYKRSICVFINPNIYDVFAENIPSQS